MKLCHFEYLKPDSIEEVCRLLEEKGEQARVFAGGTDLLVRMRDGLLQPDYLIDLKNIPVLHQISYDETEGLTIGATAHLNQIVWNEAVQNFYPLLAEGANSVGSLQIKNRGTLGGNICNASPLADTAPALLIYEASVMIIGPAGGRTVPIADFFTGPGQTVLQPGEIVSQIKVPLPPKNAVGMYYKHARRKAVDLASVGVGILLINPVGNRVESVRLALGAVAPVPVRARQGEGLLENVEVTAELLEKVQSALLADISPISDVRASKEHRLEISRVLVKRGISELLGFYS